MPTSLVESTHSLLQNPSPPPAKRLIFDASVVERSPGFIGNKTVDQPRTYGDEPLPIKPEEKAPRNATITGRLADAGKPPRYTVRIDDVDVDKVGLHEILDYVSPFALEQFENRQFREERRALAAAEAAAALEEEARRKQRKERARRRGIVEYREVDDDDIKVDSADSGVGGGRTGRARPSYTHLYELPGRRRRRRRKRRPETGELEVFSDAEAEDESMLAEPIKYERPSLSRRSPVPIPGELPARRRRKRDPITDELLPLSPPSQPARPTQFVPQSTQSPRAIRSVDPTSSTNPTKTSAHIDHRKLPRRRRNPLTGELMPLGWRYDEKTGRMYQRTDSVGTAVSEMMLSREHEPKRARISSSVLSVSSASSSGDPLQDSPPVVVTPNVDAPKTELSATPDLIGDEAKATTMSAISNTQHDEPSNVSITSLPSSSSSPSSREEITLQSFLQASQARQDESSSDETSSASVAEFQPQEVDSPVKTSIMNPVASQTNTTAKEHSHEDEDEWFVEAIVGHRLSDPRTHPGKGQIMLYHTKWEGYSQLTWEPASTFSDPSTVAEYRKRAGIDSRKPAVQTEAKSIKSPKLPPAPGKKSSRASALQASTSRRSSSLRRQIARKSEGNEFTGRVHAGDIADRDENKAKGKADARTNADDDAHEDGWEVEKILAHRMSNPRSHPGRPQTMLYQVQWVGWDETTWEPISSFLDRDPVNRYRKKAGLLPL